MFPEELQAAATSLRIVAGQPISREAIATALLRHIDRELRRLQDQTSDIFQRFEHTSTWTSGKRVHVAEDEGYTGITAGLTADGLLRIACDDGTLRTVRHGGVREL